MNNAPRMLFLTMAVILFTGIALTGFATAHWLLYLPVAFLTFAAITGICPGLVVLKAMGIGK